MAGMPGMPDRCLTFHIGHAALYEYSFGPERKVFADARLEVIGPELFEQYTELQKRIARNGAGWATELAQMKQPVVLVDHYGATALGASFLAQGHWRCVWFDPIAAVFLHESYADMAQAYTVDFAARHFRPDPSTDPRGAAEWLAESKALFKYAGALSELGRSSLARPLIALGLDYARRLVRTTPSDPEGWQRLGYLEMARESRVNGEAIPRFRMAFNPVMDLPLVRATYAFRQALDPAPEDFLTLFGLTLVYRMRGMDEAELAMLERLVKLPPADPKQQEAQAGSAAQLEAMRARLGPAPGRAPPPNRSEHDKLVASLLANGRAASVADLLERDYPAEARSWEVTDRLATLRLHLGEPARARAIWQQANDPPSAALRSALVAVTYLVEGDFEAARRTYREALALDPKLFEALYGLAVLEQDAGRATEALEAASQAVANAPNDVAKTAAQNIATWVAPYADSTAARP
jgi:tetratricopeptide (TPR) repeat protein